MKYGFIFGDFDVFRINDLQKIQNEKKKCEFLIVGVFSDEIMKNTENRKSVLSLNERMKIVKAIKDVDYVFSVERKEQMKEKEKIIEKIETHNIESKKQKREKKYKIGFIQGTFDMFHYGHLNLINRAKDMCEKVIVGVNTDELVQSYKNKTPIVSLKERMAIVSAIKGVDKVVVMEDRNKIKAAREYGFNALIMGSDWEGTEFYKIMQEELKRIGVDVVYLPYTQGISSTKLREKISIVSK